MEEVRAKISRIGEITDAVSSEILLSHHYRCNKKIINFNNRKYYNNKLVVNSDNKEEHPLVFHNIVNDTTYYKNTAPQEAEEIIRYAKLNKDKSIGVITPFANQKKLINDLLEKNEITNVTCGTVHAFQGDEKDTVLFSLALTDKTAQATYDWFKNNKELINVATSRARDRLVILSSSRELERLHTGGENARYNDLFYTGRFDFVVYERDYNKCEIPILAIELDGREHTEDEAVRARDCKKNEICRAHGFELIRVENTYARRYNYIKEILIRYFKHING